MRLLDFSPLILSMLPYWPWYSRRVPGLLRAPPANRPGNWNKTVRYRPPSKKPRQEAGLRWPRYAEDGKRAAEACISCAKGLDGSEIPDTLLVIV
jgi:hypothetical protein